MDWSIPDIFRLHLLEVGQYHVATCMLGTPTSRVCGSYSYATSSGGLQLQSSLSLIGVVDGRRLHCTPAMDRDVPQCMTFHFHAVRGSVVFKRSPAHRNSFQVRHSTLVNIRNLQSSANLSFADRLRTRCYKGLCRGPRFRNPCCERMQRHRRKSNAYKKQFQVSIQYTFRRRVFWGVWRTNGCFRFWLR